MISYWMGTRQIPQLTNIAGRSTAASVNESEECVDIFQSNISQRSTKTLGDTQLKEFIESLQQLQTIEGIDSIISTTENTQLKRLINEKRD